MSTPPAPVITEGGTWGTPPPPYRPPAARGSGSIGLGLAFLVMFALWLGVASVARLSNAPVRHAAAVRLLAALSEVDALLAAQEPTICAHLAPGSGTTGPIEVPGFPLPGVQVPPEAVRCSEGRLDRATLREALLARGADLLMLRGAEAFRPPGRTAEAASTLSKAGAATLLLDFVALPLHWWAALAAWLLGIGAAVLGAMILTRGGGTAGLMRLGVLVVIGSLPVLLGALALRVLAGQLEGGPSDAFLAALASVVRTLAALPLRDALWLAGGGVALAVAGRLVRQ